MSTKFQTLPKYWKITCVVLVILFVAPLFYIAVYRPADYFLCRSLVSKKLGMRLSPFTLEEYIQETLLPGMTQDEVVSTLDEIGRVKIIHLGNLNGEQIDQINLQICTDPLNRIIVFTNYADGRLVSIKIAND